MANDTNIHDRIEKLRDALSDGLYEKEEAVRLSLLAAVAGESVFFLGAPGCAKSMIARRITQAFKAEEKEKDDGKVRYFETLLNQFSTPEDVFGNISLKALNGELKENGNKEEYRRLTENMLPEADIAFLDEIWKASPAILNSLLTIINERKFHNGSTVMDVPLKTLFTASNELPAKGKGLEALYDRLILRLRVGFIESEEKFLDMIEGPSKPEFKFPDGVEPITKTKLEEWSKKIDEVTLSEKAKAVITAIRKEMTVRNEKMSDEEKANGEQFEVGDRRWKKIARILKTSAFLNDRAEADLMDCQLIEHCIWSTEKQRANAREIVEKCIKENGLDCDTAIEDINEQIGEFKEVVNESWFEDGPETDRIVTVDGQKCYVCSLNNNTYYVSVELSKHYSHNNYHDVYDFNKNHVTHSSFSRNGDAISCWQNFTIQKNPAKKYARLIKRSDIAHETLQKKFDKEHYTPIVETINKEIQSLKDTMQEQAVPFKANLFANQEYNASITAKLEDAVRELQDAEVALQKERSRYFKEISATFAVGDVILADGTVFAADEIPSLSAEQKQKAVAIICIAGEKTYALGLKEGKRKWDKTVEFAKQYGESMPDAYKKDWLVPKAELLGDIWDNKDVINEAIESLGFDTLGEYEYWSYTTEGEAAFYRTFDGRGHKDHTTKDHEYAVRPIREWKKD